MRNIATTSGEVVMHIHTNEYPRVAHIVADLDSIESDMDLDLPLGASAKMMFDVRRYRPSIRRTVMRSAVSLGLVLYATACASTGATFRSGVGDAFLEKAPYYAGASASSVSASVGKVAHTPIVFQSGASQAPMFDPETGHGSAIAKLLGEMNAYLGTLKASVPIAMDADAIAPDVHFGCLAQGAMSGEDCTARGDSALGRGRQAMRLAVGRPSDAWVVSTQAQLAQSGATHTLVITLEMGQYLMRQTGWRGSKSVELGIGNVQSLPWLSSLETPVPVLQLTGALIDNNGKAVRIGAEGIAAQRTRLLVSAVGGQELFGDEEVAKVRIARRDDLPGQPLAWQVALRTLVAELTGQNP
jgi:hypothetical protein